ncbi:MAG TPA: gluconate 2-dehydrogenase subunit 3 family protein [Rhodothermia bacterium]|nr:gluconate 2-dehydrogenase subunit 3 family protein [Rhodothermia bacterium]
MAGHEDTSNRLEGTGLIDRREAIRRVAVLLGGTTLVGGSALLAACERERPQAAATGSIGDFTPADVAYLDEIAETILPETKTPGAKAAKTGAFMALMVTDTYKPTDQKVFRDGMLKLDEASQKANNASFMSATPQQRLALLETLDREAKAHMEARDAARKARSRAATKPDDEAKAEAHLPDQRKELAPGADVGAASAITADTPTHYFRMMKELALLGYFTSEIGCTQAQRYVESPGRFDPCLPYRPGEKAWAPHA